MAAGTNHALNSTATAYPIGVASGSQSNPRCVTVPGNGTASAAASPTDGFGAGLPPTFDVGAVTGRSRRGASTGRTRNASPTGRPG